MCVRRLTQKGMFLLQPPITHRHTYMQVCMHVQTSTDAPCMLLVKSLDLPLMEEIFGKRHRLFAVEYLNSQG